MKSDKSTRQVARRLRTAGFAAVAVLAHLALIWGVSQVRPSSPVVAASPTMNVLLLPAFAPPPPPPPPSPERPAPDPGGGRPAAPSVVRPAPAPDRPPEVAAPATPAPEQELIVGLAPEATPTSDSGQGGEGAGVGGGRGDGAGSGSGGRPAFVRGPTLRDIIARYPPAARAARLDGQVELRCRVRLDQRLEACSILRETPPGHGFGAAAIAVSESAFRFRPPMQNGRPVAASEVVVGVTFGRGGAGH